MCWHGEVGKNQQEHEQIVDAQGFLDEVARQELQRRARAAFVGDQRGKRQGQPDPHGAPRHRFLELDLVFPAVDHAEIERQHRQHKNIE